MQSIGERLEDARKQRGLSIRESADATKVRGDYLQKFENNRFDLGLSEIYVRGFLRSYANYLKLPADRIVQEFAALGHGEVRPRQPSREVYGRMDLSVSAADEAGESPSAVPEAEAAEAARQAPRVPRSSRGIPEAPLLDQNTIYKGLMVLGCIVIAGILIVVVKSLYLGGSSEPGVRPVQSPAAPAQPAQDSTISIVATAPVRIKVVKRSDPGTDLFQGDLAESESREFPNVPLIVTADHFENIQVEYKGKRWNLKEQGFGRYTVDFSKM